MMMKQMFGAVVSLLGSLLLCVSWTVAGVVCDGVDDDLIGSALANLLSNTTGTMALWFRPAGTPLTDTACFNGEKLMVGNASGNGSPGLTRLVLSGADRVCAGNFDGSVETQVSTPVTVGNWTHLVWVHESGTLFLYQEGMLIGSVASGTTEDVTPTFLVCGGSSGFSPAEGTVTEVRTWSTALTAGEIANVAQSRMAFVGIRQGSAYWPLDQCGEGASGQGVGFVDRSGNGQTLTGDDGANNTGLTCQASEFLSYPWGAN
jgi:hypothetical protein